MEEVKEEKKKGNNGLIILVVIILLLCVGIGAFVFMNKDKIFAKDTQSTQENASKTEEVQKEENASKTEEVKEEKNLTDDIKTYLKELSNVVFELDKSSLKVNDIDKKRLIYNLVAINNLVAIDKKGSITDITGTRLKELALKYYNISDLELVDITCDWDHNNKGTNVMYIYNSSIDKYKDNPEHAGHGGSSLGIGAYKFDDKVFEEDDNYIYSTHVFYEDIGCIYDTCGPLEKLDIYYTYEDAVNKTNKVMDASTDSSLCEKIKPAGYKCDDNKIYDKIKENTKTVNFYYRKANDNYIFEKYKIVD